MRYEYFVTPAFDQLVQGTFTTETAQAGCQQLQTLLNYYSNQGWEYYRTEAVATHVQPGCLAMLFGGRTTAYYYKQIIFRRLMEQGTAGGSGQS